MKIDLTLPDGWFIKKLEHVHTPVLYVNDTHYPLGWLCEVQCTPFGGRLLTGRGSCPKGAIESAIYKIKEQPQ